MPYPNLILAGAPKSGTSSLFKWLISHPEISVTSMDETYYLLDKNNPYLRKYNYHNNDLDIYKSQNNVSNKTKILLEYCTHYMYQNTAIDVLSNFEVKPYIIFVLRQPSMRTFSSFSFSQNNKLSINQDFSFDQFIDLIFNEKLNEIQNNCLNEKSFFSRKTELAYSRYYDYLSLWLNKFQKNSLKVILFEELVRDPKLILKSICQDLGIDDNFYNEYSFVSQNKTRKVKNKLLHRGILSLKSILPQNNFTKKISNIYWSVQNEKIPLEKIDNFTLNKLNEYFKPYNEVLAKEFDLELSTWK